MSNYTRQTSELITKNYKATHKSKLQSWTRENCDWHWPWGSGASVLDKNQLVVAPSWHATHPLVGRKWLEDNSESIVFFEQCVLNIRLYWIYSDLRFFFILQYYLGILVSYYGIFFTQTFYVIGINSSQVERMWVVAITWMIFWTSEISAAKGAWGLFDQRANL